MSRELDALKAELEQHERNVSYTFGRARTEGESVDLECQKLMLERSIKLRARIKELESREPNQ